jgi:hypothetical protein
MELNNIKEIIDYKIVNSNNIYPLIENIKIKYKSDDLYIQGFIFKKTNKKLPVVIYCRGGNNNPLIGSKTYTIAHIIEHHKELFELVNNEKIILFFTNYRGNGNGIDEFGGKDINDIINLYPIIKQYKYSDENNIGIYAWSRGCMMAFLVHKKVNWIKCIIVGAPNIDLLYDEKFRPTMFNNYLDIFNLSIKDIKKRSAKYWIKKFPKNVPILILHGTSDTRVSVKNSLLLSLKLLKYKIPYKLINYPNGDHGLTEYKQQVFNETIDFFTKYLIYV